jgi:AAA+ superfamily predicted ATPase
MDTTKESGIELIVQEPEKIYSDLKKIKLNMDYHLLECSLFGDLNYLDLKAKSNGEEYTIYGTIGFKFTQDNKAVKLDMNFLKLLYNNVSISNDGAIIYDEKNEPCISIYHPNTMNYYLISFGAGFGSIKSPVSVKKLGSASDFKTAIERNIKELEKILNGYYIGRGVNIPKTKYYISRDGGNFDQKPDISSEGPGLLNIPKITPMDKTGKNRKIVYFDDVIGQDEAKEAFLKLKEAIKNPEIYKKWGTNPSKGILLHGPSGTGKTLLARALAYETDSDFFEIICSDLTNPYFGMTERILKSYISEADRCERAIVFFDEIEAIAGKRTESSGATNRCTGTLLKLLEDSKSFFVGSTNLLDAVDSGLLRPNRFDLIIPTYLPNESERKQLFLLFRDNAENNTDIKERKVLFDSLDWDITAKRSENLTGADIQEVIRRVLENKAQIEISTGATPTGVTEADLLEEIRKYDYTRGQKGFL